VATLLSCKARQATPKRADPKRASQTTGSDKPAPPPAPLTSRRPERVTGSFAALGETILAAARTEPEQGGGESVTPRAPLSLTTSDGTGLALVALTAHAALEGPLALTELHLTFRNPEPREIEGRFSITLPPQAAISRLAMKLPGGWQEAEVVERQAARQAYEDFLHRKQDPALMEKKAGNQFRARIFPIPAHGLKEIKIAYSQETTGGTYRLPLKGLPRISRLDVTVLGGAVPRRLSRQEHQPTQDVTVPTQSRAPGLRHDNIVLAHLTPELSTDREQVTLRSLLVLLDTSASRAPGFGAQVEQLGALVAQLRRLHGDHMRLRVACFDQTVSAIFEGSAGRFGKQDLQRILERRALGASDLAAALGWAADQGGSYQRLLLVTDGVATAGQSEGDALHRAARKLPVERVDVVLVGGIRDEALATRLARGTVKQDGTVLDGEQPADELARRLSRRTVSGVEVDVKGARWVWPSRLDGIQPGDRVVVYADVPGLKANVVTVSLSGPLRQQHHIKLAHARRPLLERAWVQARIDRLIDERDRSAAGDAARRAAIRKEILELSTRFRVLTDETALLVLETEADYARFRIDRRALVDILTVGPQGVELLHRSELVTGGRTRRPAARAARQDDRRPPGGAPPSARAARAEERKMGMARAAAPRIARPSAPPRMKRKMDANELDKAASDDLIDGAISGRRAARARRAPPRQASPPAREEPEQDEDEDRTPPYSGQMARVMRMIRRGKTEAAVVATLRWHDEQPGDVLALVALGRAVARHGQLELAARVFGSIIDLYPSRADLRRFAGALLEALGQTGQALAADTYRQAVKLRPDHPHGHRMLAYALLRLGQHEQAFDALEAGLKRSYPEDRFEGAPQILREDLGLIAAAWDRAAPGKRAEIDGRLRRHRAWRPGKISLRFVLSWETDANDVDFHIRDGEGGHASYEQMELGSGGSLYADVTTGYGPECFAIHGRPRAFPYRLQLHYYSRGPMGYGMGKLEVMRHDGRGGLTFDQRPFVVMNDGAFVDLGRVSRSMRWQEPWITRRDRRRGRTRKTPRRLGRLARSDVLSGMRQVRPRAQACFKRHGQPGLANVRLTIAPTGRVTSAETKGLFAGTPTGACVEQAVRTARFSTFNGPPLTVTFPFILR